VGANGCRGGAHGLAEGAHGKGARTTWGDAHGRGRARLGGARTAGGSQGSREWGQGGGFASSSLLLASSLHDWLTFGFSIQEIS
jgi:hypothetical protein